MCDNLDGALGVGDVDENEAPVDVDVDAFMADSAPSAADVARVGALTDPVTWLLAVAESMVQNRPDVMTLTEGLVIVHGAVKALLALGGLPCDRATVGDYTPDSTTVEEVLRIGHAYTTCVLAYAASPMATTEVRAVLADAARAMGAWEAPIV